MAHDNPLLLDRFMADGYAGPFPLVDPAEAPGLRDAYCRTAGVDPRACGPATRPLAAWHHHHRWAYDLACSPRILDRVECLLGPDILLWAWFSWYKEPRTGKRIPWHQDASYWPIEPKRNVTAWVALDATDTENGCLRVIPGSHRSAIDHVAVDDPGSWFSQGADLSAVDAGRAVDLALRAGEFVLFNEGTLHGSEPNRSDRPRIAFSLRYTSPDVCLHGDRWGDDRVKAFLVRGEDRHHRNDAWIGTPPAA
jgi:ectoine hydroxylase-related dioxygenase (phytanoyl-CoA dioxygenase family)